MAKTKALISFAVTAKLICVFVFAYAKIRFSHVAAHITDIVLSPVDNLQSVRSFEKVSHNFSRKNNSVFGCVFSI